MGSRNRQVMSPNAHLPMRLLFSSFNTDRSILSILLLLLLLNLIHGNVPVTVSLLPIATALTRTFCLSQAVLTGSHEFQSWRSGPETDTDLCQCLSLHHCLCALHTFLAQLQTKPFLFSQFTLASIASLASRLSLTLAFPPGSLRGVRRKRSSEAPEILFFARLCRHIPTAGGSFFLGFTPCPRPRVRGPTPLLIKLGCLPGPVRGVREKTASKAVSFLVLFCLLFLLVFAQAPAAQHTHTHTHTRTEPMKNVCFCPLDSGNCGFLSCLCCTHPFEKGQIQNSLLLRSARAA